MLQGKAGGGLNIVSVTLLLAVVAAGYGAVKFGPPHWRKWQAKEVLDDTASRFLGNRAPSADVDAQLAGELRTSAIARLRALGITDPALNVSITRQGEQATIAAEYREQVRHPIGDKITVLVFRPFVVRSRTP